MILVVDGKRTDWEQRAINQAAVDIGWELYKAYNDSDICQLEGYSGYNYKSVRTYGSVEFTDNVNKWLNLDLIDMPLDFVPRLPEKWRGRWVKLIMPRYTSEYNLHPPLFLKPARNKEFPAKVYDDIPDNNIWNYPVLASEPVVFTVEVRCFIRNQRLLTYSPYMYNMEPIELLNPNDTYWDTVSHMKEMYSLETYVNIFLDEVDCPRSCVVDFGYIKDKGWVVIEANNPHSSGLYDCDAEPVLRCLEYGING